MPSVVEIADFFEENGKLIIENLGVFAVWTVLVAAVCIFIFQRKTKKQREALNAANDEIARLRGILAASEETLLLAEPARSGGGSAEKISAGIQKKFK